MTYGQLTSGLQTRWMGRSDAEFLALAAANLAQAHRAVQRGAFVDERGEPRVHNWRCLETSADVAYDNEDGLALPADYKSARELWELDADSEPLGMVLPSTQGGMQVVELARGGARSAADRINLGQQAFAQRWFEKDGAIRLLTPPTEATTFRLFYYKYLAFYADSDASDWFSIHAYDVLLDEAARLTALHLGDDALGGTYAREAMAGMNKAVAFDARAKQGGAATVLHSPMPIPRRRVY